MEKLSPSPNNFLHGRRRNTALPAILSTGAKAYALVSPSNVSRFFATASEAGVSLYSTAMEGEEFRILYQSGADLYQVGLSNTPWLQDAPFLHEDPPFGSPDVPYHLEVRVGDTWQRAGTKTVDLSAYILTAPSIDSEKSLYNSPFVHIEINWDGDLEDLEFFQFEWQNGEVWELLVRQPEKIAHVQLQEPPAEQITVRVRADGLRLGNSAYSGSVVLTDEASDDGEPNGNNDLRSNASHKLITPNLVFNSSFEFVDPVTTLAKQWVNALTVGDAWAEKHGDRFCQETTATQLVSARMSSTDTHSFSCYSRAADGSITILNEDGGTIATISAVEGLNTIEGFRVPSTHGSFTIQLTSSAVGGFDKIQVNQGATVDPWALHAQDRTLQAIADAEDAAAQAQTNFDTVFNLLGGESGSVIQQLDASIDLVVGHLEGTQSGSFAWMNLTDNSITQITTDLNVVENDLTLAQTTINSHSTRLTNAETGITSLNSQVSSNTTAIAITNGSLSAAQTELLQISDVVFSPATGNTALSASVSALATTVGEFDDRITLTEAGYTALSGQVIDVEGDVLMLQAAFTAAAGVHATIADRFLSGESSISGLSVITTDLQGDVAEVQSQLVLKAVAAGGGKYSLAQVLLTAGTGSGSNITLSANTIDIVGTVNIMSAAQYAGLLDGQILESGTVDGNDGGALKISNVLGVGYPQALGFIGANGTHWSRSSGGGISKCIMQPYSPYFMAEGTSRTTIDDYGLQTWNGSSFSYLRPDNVTVQSGGNYSAMTANALIIAGSQIASNVAAPLTTTPSVTLKPGDPDEDILPETENKTIVDGSTLRNRALPVGMKITADGIDYTDFDDGMGGFNPSGTPIYCFRPPEHVSVALTGLSAVAVGYDLTTAAQAIVDRGTANYAVIPLPSTVLVGLTAGGDHVYAPVQIVEKTSSSFKVRVAVPPLASRSSDPTINVTVI